MTHHRLYVLNYETPEYLEAGGDNFVLWMTPPFILIGALAFLVLPWWVALTVIATVGANAFANNFMHTAFHVPTHWARKIPWFERSNRWHYQHHLNVRANLGINQYLYDRLFGTFRSRRFMRR
jgi:sterol desaturase/sphingolipid hydroxylase (fatty acid hydroxylase superfamily)